MRLRIGQKRCVAAPLRSLREKVDLYFIPHMRDKGPTIQPPLLSELHLMIENETG